MNFALRSGWSRGASAARRWLAHATEPHILFPSLAALGLAAIWWATLHLVDVERAAAEHVAVASTREMVETYEAQIVRALREIDRTLKFVQYAHAGQGKGAVLEELKTKMLLPPDRLFVVDIVDGSGQVVASTRPLVTLNVSGRDYFESQRAEDVFAISQPRQRSGPGWTLRFSRRLTASDGSFSGIVMVTVDAAYFVSGYESAKLGEFGVLAVLGADGVFRALRSGESVSAGGRADYASIVPATHDGATDGRLSTNAWDGVQRYTSARQLYEFPLAVIVGLSADEQLAAVRGEIRNVRLWAFAGSLLLLLVVAVLGRMSRQLASSRKREAGEQIAHAVRVEFLAYHDTLTGLPNRSLFSNLLGHSLKLAQRHRRQLAVLFLDLDRFKHINDTLGHEAGDELLKEVAARLKGCLRDSDVVARLGGDEFVAMLPDLHEETYVATVARKILIAVAQPFTLAGQEFSVTASVGISIYPQDGEDETSLRKSADIAMYNAKEEGKNNFRFYSEKLNASSLERLTLESGMRHALAHGEFELHYQPKRDLRSNRITGMEALLRWRHPELGLLGPVKFLPLAEETGLVLPIGQWVLRTACLQNVAWQRQGLPDLCMSVNLTARQFADERLLPELAAMLAETGMAAHLLELEISESLLMRDVEAALRVLTPLKAMGIRIAIDDFGAGYSSLSRLRQFPLDTIKIDRSFIRTVTLAGAGNEVADAIIAMGRTLSLTLVAQGVETKEQAEFLRGHACDEYQGFHVDKPVPADQIPALFVPAPAIPGPPLLAAA